jgi:PAX-interacting protein 1
VRFGGRLTDIGRECTHIVSPRVTRTVKFLSGISVCRHIVTPEWVEECGRAGRLVDEGGYVLRDRDAEEMFDMNIAVSLTRAKKKQLLTVSA